MIATDRLDRAVGALTGLAVGDALGMPTQLLTRAQVQMRYGEVLDRFHPGPSDHPIARGMPAGRVTDDTDQAMIIAGLIISGRGRVDPYELVAELRRWQSRMIAAGSADLLGPSTQAALDRLAAGEDLSTAGRDGTTNGAAMRIAPVGIATASAPVSDLLERVAATCRTTHHTSIAIAGAAAVAAVVSAGIDGATVPEALELGVHAVRTVEADCSGAYGRAIRTEGAALADRIGRAVLIGEAARAVPAEDPDAIRPGADGSRSAALLDQVETELGTSLEVEESIPAAMAMAAAFPASPWDAARHAASLGGDSDTIAAIAGAMVGACKGASTIREDVRAAITLANPDLDLPGIAEALLRLRPAAINKVVNHRPGRTSGL